MPPLTCGIRVERYQEKLVCQQRKQLFHPDCCYIKPEEVEFVKEIFKCGSCVRRSSSSTDIGTAKVNDNLSLLDLAIDAHELAPKPLAADNIPALLNTLIPEVAIVKISNANLQVEFASFWDENSVLVSKMTDMQDSEQPTFESTTALLKALMSDLAEVKNAILPCMGRLPHFALRMRFSLPRYPCKISICRYPLNGYHVLYHPTPLYLRLNGRKWMHYWRKEQFHQT